MVAGSIALVAMLALSACASGYDSVLWRLMDKQESEAYRVIDEAKATAATPVEFVADLKGLPTYWDERSLPSIDPQQPATLYYNVQEDQLDEFGDQVISFDVLVHSGVRPQQTPAEYPGNQRGGRYSGPPSIYTCYRLVVTFVADRVWQQHRSRDSGSELLDCPEELEQLIADGAVYAEPTEFDG